MRKLFLLFVILVAFIFVIGCDKDNPVNEDEHSDHAEAVGLVITQNDSEIVRYEEGVVTGAIAVQAGEETGLLFVEFIAEDGDLFSPDSDHHSLDWTVADQTVAQATLSETQDNDADAWKFSVAGLKAGETTIEIKILHEDHSDFVSLPIGIQVAE